jgi:hypothetical protein
VGRGRPNPIGGDFGDRLWIFSAPAVAGPWPPSLEERLRIIEQVMPNAHFETTDENSGPVSRPDVVADLVRRAMEAQK